MDPKANEPNDGSTLQPGTVLVLWLVVALELILPVPGVLTLGAAWVLLVRPPWFLALVRGLYAGRAPAS